MTTESFARELLHLNGDDGITHQHVLEFGFGSLVNQGLQVLSICEHGGYYSRMLTSFLIEQGVLSARLFGGLQGLWIDTPDSKKVIACLAAVPLVSVIFSDSYLDVYENVLAKINNRCTMVHFPDIESARQEILFLVKTQLI